MGLSSFLLARAPFLLLPRSGTVARTSSLLLLPQLVTLTALSACASGLELVSLIDLRASRKQRFCDVAFWIRALPSTAYLRQHGSPFARRCQPGLCRLSACCRGHGKGDGQRERFNSVPRSVKAQHELSAPSARRDTFCCLRLAHPSALRLLLLQLLTLGRLLLTVPSQQLQGLPVPAANRGCPLLSRRVAGRWRKTEAPEVVLPTLQQHGHDDRAFCEPLCSDAEDRI